MNVHPLRTYTVLPWENVWLRSCLYSLLKWINVIFFCSAKTQNIAKSNDSDSHFHYYCTLLDRSIRWQCHLDTHTCAHTTHTESVWERERETDNKCMKIEGLVIDSVYKVLYSHLNPAVKIGSPNNQVSCLPQCLHNVFHHLHTTDSTIA